jgi:hypothetical protein
LWKSRTLVKTSLMRQTLHLVPSDEFPIYIAALKLSRMAGALRIMSKFGIGREEAEGLTALIMESLGEGPLGRAAIRAAVRPKVSKRVHRWMEKVWSIMRLPVAEGLVCYGGGEDKEVSFIRADRWLPGLKAKPISAVEAQGALFRKHLRAYGPATVADFAHWAGISMQEAKAIPVLLESELAEISGEKRKVYLLRNDADVLKKTAAGKDSIRLLPNFDVFLLAHRDKDHLIAEKHYKRVYRNQGWISPVVLIDGAVAGVWSYKFLNKKLLVTIEGLGKFSRAIRAGVEREAESLAGFFQGDLECKFE